MLPSNKNFRHAIAVLQEDVMTKSKTSISKIFVWILLGFLFVGLIGFGTGNLSGNIKTIGKIGETEITVNQYVRALQTELRNTSQQFGQQLTLQQLQAFGIQQQVLARLVTDKLLENEAAKLSLSVDDKTVRDNIVSLNVFKGPMETLIKTHIIMHLKMLDIRQRNLKRKYVRKRLVIFFHKVSYREI